MNYTAKTWWILKQNQIQWNWVFFFIFIFHRLMKKSNQSSNGNNGNHRNNLQNFVILVVIRCDLLFYVNAVYGACFVQIKIHYKISKTLSLAQHFQHCWKLNFRQNTESNLSLIHFDENGFVFCAQHLSAFIDSNLRSGLYLYCSKKRKFSQNN